jgi:uncharacterized protein
MHHLTIRGLAGLFLGFAVLLSRADDPVMAPVWKISDADSTVYLAGSIHLLREKDLPLPAVFERAYAEAEELVFEIDMATMSAPDSAQKMRALGSLPAGEELGDKVSGATMERLGEYLKKRGMPRGVFDTFTPGMVYLTIGALEVARSGAKPDLGLEMVYFGKSVRDGKPSSGLETVAFQMSRFNEFGTEFIEELITESIAEADESPEVFDAIVAAWRSGDEEALGDLILEQTGPHSRLHEILLVDRNRNWIPGIEKHLATNRDVMFLVGAGHLVGEDSVVDLLREKGYEVKQLANDE